MKSEKLILPDFDDLKKGIDELLLVDNWDRYKIKSSPKKFKKRLMQLFTEKLGLFPHILMFTDSDSFPFKFYRLRKKNKSMNPELISEYSYPPNHDVRYTQRANLPYNPVFYSADNAMSAIFETVRNEKTINPNQDYYLSEWQLKSGTKLKISPFLFGNVHESSPYKLFSDDSFLKLEEILKQYSSEQIDNVKRIMNLLSYLFVYDNTYAVSSFIAHSYLYAKHSFRTDIFIYPSTQTDFKTVNFAIHPNTVFEKLQLNKVYRLKVESFDKWKGSCSVNINQVGIYKDSIIFWESINENTGDKCDLINEMKHLFEPF